MSASCSRSRAKRRSIKERLAIYPDEVLRATIAVEQARIDTRPMFIQLLEAELERRHKEKTS